MSNKQRQLHLNYFTAYNFPFVTTSIPGPTWFAWNPPSSYDWFSLKEVIAAIERKVRGSHIARFARTFLFR